MMMLAQKIRQCEDAGDDFETAKEKVLDYHNHLHTLFCLESMEEIRLYDINSIEFSELIDAARVELKNNNPEYKELQNKVSEIMEMYPNLQLLFEDDKAMNLNEEECKMLQKLVSLYLQMSDYEDRKIFFLGARENYFYFKNLGIIKG